MPRHKHTWVENELMTEADDMGWWDDCTTCGARRLIDMERGTTVYLPERTTYRVTPKQS